MRMIKAFAVVTAALLAGCAQSGGGSGSAEMDYSKEALEYEYRHAVMELIGAKTRVLAEMARGEIPDDQALFTKSASDLVVLSGMVMEGFQTNIIASGSRASPEIWANMDDFKLKAQDAIDAVKAVSDAAQNGDFAGAKELASNISPTCGGCHRPYRAAEE